VEIFTEQLTIEMPTKFIFPFDWIREGKRDNGEIVRFNSRFSLAAIVATARANHKFFLFLFSFSSSFL